VIPVSDASAQPVRINPVFPQGPASPTLVEAVTARALNLRDGQIVQATVQSRADEMVLMLRGRQVGIARVPGWEVGQRLSFRTQANPDGSVALVLINGKASAYSNPGLPTFIEAQSRPVNNQPPPNPNPQNDTAHERNPQALAAPATPPSNPVVAVQNLQASALAGLSWAPLSPSEGKFSRLGSLMYRNPGMPELRDLLKPGGLDALLAKVAKQPEVQAQLQNQLQAMRLTMQKLSPEEISAALRAALGSETSLPRIRNPAPNDLKPLLHKLLSLMEDKTEEDTAGMHQVKRALADLDAAQLAAMQAQHMGEMSMSVVLPFVDHAPVELAFERKRTSDDEESRYTVNMHSNSRDYGELWLQADLLGGDTVALSMWAVRPAVVDFARQGQAELRKTLGEAGLTLRSFAAHLGERPAPEPLIQPLALPGEVVDMRA
jgi:hypothetical protein